MKKLSWNVLVGLLALVFGGGCGDDEPTPDLVDSTFSLRHTIDPAPVDPLAGSDIESCGVYGEERCAGGVSQLCQAYDVGAKMLLEGVVALLEGKI